MNVAIFSRKILDRELVFFQNLLLVSSQMNWNLIIEKDFYTQLKKAIPIKRKYNVFQNHLDIKEGIDLMISIGGDGTFLKAVNYVRSSGVPMLGINTGRLGFLSDINTVDFEEVLQKIVNKDYSYQQRSLIQVQTEDDIFGTENFALNELAIHKKDDASMITVEAYLGDEYLNTYWADGLLVGTSTGSTAYSLSCGGPIISPGCGVHFITPIAAHNLNVRPLVVPDQLPIRLKAHGRSNHFLLSLDAFSKTVENGTEIIVSKADFQINVLKFKDNGFFKTLRNKMLWGIDQRND